MNLFIYLVFKANKSEMEWVVERCGHNMELSRDDACVRLRGLPFDCTIDEIINFFSGMYYAHFIF